MKERKPIWKKTPQKKEQFDQQILSELKEKHWFVFKHGSCFFKIKYGEDEFVITIVIVEGDVVLEDVCSTLHWHDIVDNKLAKSGKEISSLVQFLNLRVVVHLIVFLVDEDVILNEVIDQLHHCRISLYSSDANMHTISFKVTFNEIGYI